ncbi:MAG: response regulator [Methylococcales bacterium]|nr:response regulator [Methylococcales bacterium]
MKTIVLVDDVQFNLTLLWHLVKRMDGFLPIAFIKPEEALEWCLNNDYELIIVDYMMPKMNGVEFITKLKASPKKKDIPILMVTANNVLSVRYQALEAGATDFLNKPIDKTEFNIRVQNMLILRDHQHKLADKALWLNNEVMKATKEIRERETEIVYRLSKTAEYRDPETGGHIKRMSLYSKHIAVQLGFSFLEQNLISQAASMHDIGKVGVPDAILLKPGRLDIAEFELMKEHTKIGYEILNGSSSQLLQMGAEIALSHHEKYDGSGYPYGLKGEEISIYGRIIAVADVFDALISERPYKKAWPLEKVIDFLSENTFKHFDPLCINAFFKEWDKVLEIRATFDDK